MQREYPPRGQDVIPTAVVLPPPGTAGDDAHVAAQRSLGQAVRGRLIAARLRVRRRGRSALFRAARLTGAAVAAYLVAEALGLDDTPPLVAALTALLVVQATASGTLSTGVERVLSVVAGVAIAVAFSALVGLTWWSLAILVAASIVVGQLLRLGPNLIEVPISAMLVLGASGAESVGAGTRGRGSERSAAPIWGVDEEEYFRRCEPWPLDPGGELLLGVKIESPEGVARCGEILAVPGIGFAELGPGDLGLSLLGRTSLQLSPYPPEMREARDRVFAACRANGVAFLEACSPDTVAARIDEGVRVIAGGREDTARAGRAHQRRAMPV